MESSIQVQGVKIIVLHSASCDCDSYLIIFMWIIGIVGMSSIARPLSQQLRLTHSHPSHSVGNILINTENISSLSVYICVSSTLFVYSPQRKDISRVRVSLVYCLWSHSHVTPDCGQGLALNVLNVSSMLAQTVSAHSVLSWPAGLPYRQFTWYDFTWQPMNVLHQ